MTPAEQAEIFAQFVGVPGKKPVDKIGGRKNDIVRKPQFDAKLGADGGLLLQLSGGVRIGGTKIRPFHIDVRLQPTQEFHRRRPFVDGHGPHRPQGGQGLGAEPLRKGRAVGPLVHIAIRTDRHKKLVSEAAGRFQIANMADVQQIKTAMRQHDSFARTLKLRRKFRHAGEGNHLGRSRHGCCSFVVAHSRPPGAFCD